MRATRAAGATPAPFRRGRAATLALAALAGAVALGAPPLPARADPAADYARYCRECHGAEGTGTGVAAGIAMTPVADLTTIAARNDGFFPRARVIATIRGDEGVAAHALTGMPGWLATFRDDGGSLASPYPLEVAVDRRIEALADWIGARQR